MLSSGTSQASAIFPSPGGISHSCSAMTAAAAAAAPPDEDAIFGVGADETFFSSIGALAASPSPSPPPPSTSSSHIHATTSPDLRWPSSYGALVASAASSSTLATMAYNPSATTAGSALAGSSAAAGDPFSPLLAPPHPTTFDQRLGPPDPSLLPPGSTSAVGGEGNMAPVQAPAARMPPPPPLPVQLPPSASAAPRAKTTASGLTKSRAKGGGIRQKRSKSGGSSSTAAAVRRGAGLDDGEPDKKVPLLIVGSKTRQLAREADVGGGNNDGSKGAAAAAFSLDDTVKMLTIEMGRNGREVETDDVNTGQRAVHQVKALAGCDMRYGMVVLEVEESLAAATEVARELRCVHRWVGGWVGVRVCAIAGSESNSILRTPSATYQRRRNAKDVFAPRRNQSSMSAVVFLTAEAPSRSGAAHPGSYTPRHGATNSVDVPPQLSFFSLAGWTDTPPSRLPSPPRLRTHPPATSQHNTINTGMPTATPR